MILDPEDEAFNEIERQAKQRKEAVLQALHSENERTWVGLTDEDIAMWRPRFKFSEALLGKSKPNLRRRTHDIPRKGQGITRSGQGKVFQANHGSG